MSCRGYLGDGGASSALARSADREHWGKPERSKTYVDDWDAAKEASRAAAVGGGIGLHKVDGEGTGPRADRTGNQPVDGLGEVNRGTVTKAEAGRLGIGL